MQIHCIIIRIFALTLTHTHLRVLQLEKISSLGFSRRKDEMTTFSTHNQTICRWFSSSSSLHQLHLQMRWVRIIKAVHLDFMQTKI